MKTKWPFADPQNVAVFTSKEIVEQTLCIQYVTHDFEDGAWQFHGIDGPPDNDNEARLVSLKTIVDMDPTVKELANLPLGWIAWRAKPDSRWHRKPKED